MTDSDITLGELARGLSSLERRINESFGQINRRLDNLHFVPRDVYEVQIRQMNEEIEDLQESKRWLVRTLVISFLFPIIVAIVIVSAVAK